jgi:hypothetical protein
MRAKAWLLLALFTSCPALAADPDLAPPKLPCALNEEDYQSLANAKAGPLLPADLAALSSGDQRDLCRARKFYREARGKDPETYAKTHTEADVPIHLARFTTSAEYDQVRPAGMAIMLKAIERGPAPKPGR